MLEVLGQFRVVIKSVRRHYQQVERQSGVSGAQLWALAHIAETHGSTVGELARSLAIHPSTASNLVRRLVSMDFVLRKRTGKDQRSVQLYLTGKGMRAIRRAPRPLIGVLQQALSEMPARGLTGLHRLLAELIVRMKVKDARAKTTPISDM